MPPAANGSSRPSFADRQEAKSSPVKLKAPPFTRGRGLCSLITAAPHGARSLFQNWLSDRDYGEGAIETNPNSFSAITHQRLKQTPQSPKFKAFRQKELLATDITRRELFRDYSEYGSAIEKFHFGVPDRISRAASLSG